MVWCVTLFHAGYHSGRGGSGVNVAAVENQRMSNTQSERGRYEGGPIPLCTNV